MCETDISSSYTTVTSSVAYLILPCELGMSEELVLVYKYIFMIFVTNNFCLIYFNIHVLEG